MTSEGLERGTWVNVIRGKRAHAEAGRADGAGGGTLSRRGVLGGLAALPGTNALWDPWKGSHNGKGLTEDAFDNATKVILNQDFVSGLTQPAKLLDYFPYLSPPPES